jgi:dipeptidyl aminopeptidase/acylaminoacyl peptidase
LPNLGGLRKLPGHRDPTAHEVAMKPHAIATQLLTLAAFAAVLASPAPASAQPATQPATQPAPPHPAAAPSTFTLERVLSYGFPTDLVAAPTGQRVAWVENREGMRNVMVAEAPDWNPRALTRYVNDDGHEITGLRFLATGDRLVYVRGSSPNSSGEVANPTSDPSGASRDLWIVGLEGDPQKLAVGVNPVPSPTDARLVWSEGGQAWLVDLGRGAAEPRELFRVRGGLGDLVWSPDGTRLAFSSARDGRALVGVFDTREGSLRWLSNSADRDVLPRWSPDGARVAFVRNLAGYPGFSVWRVAADGGEGAVELWHSPRELEVEGGSLAYPRAVAGEYDLMYGDGYLVVPGEWTGWNHLYAIPEDGGDARDLTPGEGIVENAALAHDGASVWVSANTQSIDHRQLGRVRLADGETEWLVGGEAIAWNPAPGPGGGWLAYIRADHAEPASVYVRALGGAAATQSTQGQVTPDERPEHGAHPMESADDGRRLSVIPEDFPLDGLVKPEQVVFETEDGWTIHAQLFLPPGLEPGARAPGVLFMHGGSRRQMLLGWHNRGYYHGAYAFNQYLASRGYVVLSVNYRSGIGYGTAFRNPPNYGRQGASEYQDILDAGRWLQRHEAVDGERIGLWGGSYGGYLTALGLARNSDLFKAGVDLHGVHDWWQQTRWYGRNDERLARQWARMDPAELEEQRDLAVASSPVADMDTWTSPVLIVHGDDDRNVPFEASIDLVARLRQKGDVHFEELYFIDDVHGFYRHDNWLTTFRAAADFFDRMLAAEGGGSR